MSKIVTVAAYKGGVGKTTLALELAYPVSYTHLTLPTNREV